MTAPERSQAQRLDALAHANEIRTHRAVLKRELYQRTRNARALLLNPHPEIQTMKVIDVLLATPKIGRVKAAKLMRHAGASPSKTLAGLSDRQRDDLVGMLP